MLTNKVTLALLFGGIVLSGSRVGRPSIQGPPWSGYDSQAVTFAADAPLDPVYVDASAKGAGDGTANRPFATIRQGLSKVPVGGDLIIRGGQYQEQLVIEKAVRLCADPGSGPVLVGGRLRLSPSASIRVYTGGVLKAEYSLDLNELAQRFRPYLKFSYDDNHEHYAPCSWQWFYEQSLLAGGIQAPGGFIDPSRIGTDYAKVLAVSDIRDPSCNTDAVIYIGDDAESGQAWPEVANGSGIYCHASYIGSDFVNLEYWLLFGYNEAPSVPLGLANHKGDLVCVEIVYSVKYDRICRATFSIHGSTLEAFDVPPSNAGYVYLPGVDLNRNPTTEQALLVNVSKDHQYQDGPWEHSPSDRYLFFMNEENSTKYEHVVIFLEHGSHEPWPNSTGSYTAMPNHNGLSYSFLPSQVTLLDKDEDAPFYYFGGQFGDPAGLMRHRTWYLESDDVQVRSAIRVDRDPYYEDLSPLQWPPVVDN